LLKNRATIFYFNLFSSRLFHLLYLKKNHSHNDGTLGFKVFFLHYVVGPGRKGIYLMHKNTITPAIQIVYFYSGRPHLVSNQTPAALDIN
jgi:hypothetical protein